MIPSVAEILQKLDLLLYLDRFLEEGFNTLGSLQYIREDDFSRLGVKLGPLLIIRQNSIRQHGKLLKMSLTSFL